jgi:hypothetical protein
MMFHSAMNYILVLPGVQEKKINENTTSSVVDDAYRFVWKNKKCNAKDAQSEL